MWSTTTGCRSESSSWNNERSIRRAVGIRANSPGTRGPRLSHPEAAPRCRRPGRACLRTGRNGGGVAGALHRAAGPGLAEEGREFAPIRPGEAVITSGHRLPNRYVIHCLGPVYGRDEPADELLARCYRRALRLAEEHDIRSIAFPAISTGAFGFPMRPAARTALRTVVEETRSLSSVRRIRFVLYDPHALAVHEEVLRNFGGESGERGRTEDRR